MKRGTMGTEMLIASAAAALIISGSITARADEKMGGDVHCAGINTCKGQGACAGADNACKGKNGCKGKGFLNVKSADECAKKGGKVVEGKKM